MKLLSGKANVRGRMKEEEKKKKNLEPQRPSSNECKKDVQLSRSSRDYRGQTAENVANVTLSFQ